jgi:hypothetical protein
MASDEFLRFLEALLSDETLRGRFAALEGGGVKQSIAAIVDLGTGAGFRFDRHDVANILDRANEPLGPDLLSTGELQVVAGGRSGEQGVPVVAIPPGGGRTVLVDTTHFKRLLLEVRKAIERDGGSLAALDAAMG